MVVILFSPQNPHNHHVSIAVNENLKCNKFWKFPVAGIRIEFS
jgi:hypothetical protein